MTVEATCYDYEHVCRVMAEFFALGFVLIAYQRRLFAYVLTFESAADMHPDREAIMSHELNPFPGE